MEGEPPIEIDKNLNADRMDFFVIETNVRKAVLELLDPLLKKLNKEQGNVEKVKTQLGVQNSRISILEAAVFENKADSQFNEIRNKIVNIEKERRENEKDVSNCIENVKTDFKGVQFDIQNYITEMTGMKSSISTIKEQFKTLESMIIKDMKTLNNEISRTFQKGNDNFEKLNNRQSELDEALIERFKQLDVQNIKVSKLEGIIESYREEVNYLRGYCQKLDINKTDVVEFQDLSNQFEFVTRTIKVNHDLLVDRVMNLENFCDKYIPLISQNVVCDTLTQVVGSKEKKRLEIYEHKVYQKLHETLLTDEGSPDLEGHRNNLLQQINDKLTILTRIITKNFYAN